MNNSTKITVIILAAALAITALGAYLSYEEFQTPNFISVLYGMARVCVSEAECVEIDNSPLIVMTRGRETMEEYMMLHGGYTKKEQLGATYVFENDTHEIVVESDSKIFCIIWVIGDPKTKD